MTLSLSDARRVIAAGERRARMLGQPMNIAVVDDGGNLVSHVRMDGAWVGSVDVSINKAVTARTPDGRPTEERARDLAAAGVPRLGKPDHTDNGYRGDAYGVDAYRVDGYGSDGGGSHGGGSDGFAGGRRQERATREDGYREDRYREDRYRADAGRADTRGRDRFGDAAPAEPSRTARPVGGFPLVRDGRVVGAVGVSGGTAEDDQAVARAAAAAL